MTSNGHGSFIIGVPIEDIQKNDEEFITIEQLQHLVRLIDQSDVAELAVTHSATKARLLLRKAQPLTVAAAQTELFSIPEASSSAEEAASPVEVAHYTITAPMVGIYQSWHKSKDRPLVTIGDMITVGQHVGVIRSLDIPNEVEAPVMGRVIEILVQDGQSVEYGQPLMTIDKR